MATAHTPLTAEELRRKFKCLPESHMHTALAREQAKLRTRCWMIVRGQLVEPSDMLRAGDFVYRCGLESCGKTGTLYQFAFCSGKCADEEASCKTTRKALCDDCLLQCLVCRRRNLCGTCGDFCTDCALAAAEAQFNSCGSKRQRKAAVDCEDVEVVPAV